MTPPFFPHRRTIGRATALAAIAAATTASPQDFTPGNSTTIITESENFLCQIKTWLFSIVYVLGAIGLVIIAVTAFLGKFKWSHLISLGGGLFVVATADLIISFLGFGGGTVC